MTDPKNDVAGEVELDLDEDLFNFDEVMPDELGDDADEIDLDEIFAAFQEEGDEEAAAAAPEQEEEDPFVPAALPASRPRAAQAREASADAPADARGDEADEPEPVRERAPGTAAAAAPARRQRGGARRDDDRREEDEEEEALEPAAPSRLRRNRGRGRRGRASRTAEPRPTTLRAVTFLTKGAVVVLIGMTLLNVSIALVTFTSATGMRSDLEAASREMADAALEIRDRVDEQADAVKDQFTPVVPPTVDAHPTFDRVAADIEVGDYAGARRRIYALLAVVDRQPPPLREEVEARAAFLLARSYHAEAAAAEEVR